MINTLTFSPGDSVWLSIPTARKLDPKWVGEWVVQSIKSPVTVEVCSGRRAKIVHINRLCILGPQDAAAASDSENNQETSE